ncbi:HemK/PrmC family methyltransferase [Helicobacter sp. 23-1048]
MATTIQTAIAHGCEILEQSPLAKDFERLEQNIESKHLMAFRPRFECEILLCEILQKPRTFLHAHSNDFLPTNQENTFFSQVKERALGTPIEYLTQKASFYSCEFFIQKGVLIPRPESEILVQKALQIIKEREISVMAEIGVGSGAISTIIARHNPHLRMYATDIDSLALECARKNFARFECESISTLQGSLLEPFSTQMLDFLELVVANLPYIANDYPLPLPLCYEPKGALFGGERGSEIIESLITACAKARPLIMCCEMGYDQKTRLSEFIAPLSPKKLEFYTDLSGFDRGFVLEF